QITGDLDVIKAQIQTQSTRNTSVWLEVVYTGHEVVSGLREQIHEMVAGTQLLVLKIQNKTQYNKTLAQTSMTETLQDLSTEEVFERCLLIHNVDEGQKSSLRDAYA
ncbi:exonuclease SbcCD subunit D C-terminal domain-containing protein, partial [Psychrobacter sp. GW64-MNA-CIBAN-0177]